MNVHGTGEAYIEDIDVRSDFFSHTYTYIWIYKVGGVMFDCVCVLVGYMLISCCIHGIFVY
jgi:hypothetical protein